MHPPQKGQHGKLAPYAPDGPEDFAKLPLDYIPATGGVDIPDNGRRGPRFASLKRFFFWWLAFAGIYAGSSVCPFCGQPNCPVGPGAAGIVGVLFAALLHYGKRAYTYIRKIGNKLSRALTALCCWIR